MESSQLFSQFWKMREETSISSTQADLYYFLIHKWIGFVKKNPFQLSNKFICLHLDMSEKTLIACRARLKQVGLIDFQSGKQDKTRTTYELMYCKNYSSNDSSNSSSNDSSDSSTVGENTPDNNISNTNSSDFNSNSILTKQNRALLSEMEELKKQLAAKDSAKPASQTGERGAKNPPPELEPELVLPFGPKFESAWNNWIQYRQKIKKPYKSRMSEQAAMIELAQFDEAFAIGLITTSMANGWQGLIFEKTKENYLKQNESRNNNGSGPGYAEVGDAVDNYFERRFHGGNSKT